MSSGTLIVLLMMRRLAQLLLGLIVVISVSCGTPGIPLPPSLELPKQAVDLRAIRKGDKVYLAWAVPTETTDRKPVRRVGPTNICRALDKEIIACGTPVGKVPGQIIPLAVPAKGETSKPNKKNSPATKLSANYVDTLPQSAFPNPTGEITYAVEVLNGDHRSAGLSNQIQVPSAPTLASPTAFKASVMADGVVLSWNPVVPPSSVPELQYRYRVYHREKNTAVDTLIGELPLNASRLLERNFEWEKTYEYRADVVTVITQPDKPEIEVEGDDTAAIEVFAHDVFPPAIPAGLQAVFSGEGQQSFVDLVWSPDTDADLAGYNIYRYEEGAQPAKINLELVKTPAYRDTNVRSGKTYFYSVSAVDMRGNESTRSEEASESLP